MGEREKELDAEAALADGGAGRPAGHAARTRPTPTPRRRTRCSARWARRARPGATTSSCSAAWSTWRPAPAWPGSRFAYIKGPLVLLELALVRWALELLGDKGFEPVVPPVLVREEALFGTGLLPDTEQQIYRVPDDDLYLAGHQRGAAGVAARGRDRGGPAAALRRLLALLSPRGRAPPARTHAGSSACTSSTRWRCSRSSSPRSRRTSTSGCSRSRRRSCRRWACPTGW